MTRGDDGVTAFLKGAKNKPPDMRAVEDLLLDLGFVYREHERKNTRLGDRSVRRKLRGTLGRRANRDAGG